ncbi:NmrA family NAD(P)-binding protein [Nocardiopsis metallicus]|uniref:NAD-dependent epimerase/dehydratase family protein n=1 Tax=Nocardiopsis metallicus TaxID=179819 RepID=UPI00161F0536
MSFLVSGATGTVGCEIVRQLIDAGHRVRTLTRAPNTPRSSPAGPGGARSFPGRVWLPRVCWSITVPLPPQGIREEAVPAW